MTARYFTEMSYLGAYPRKLLIMSYLGANSRKAGVLVSQILIDVHVHFTSCDKEKDILEP